MTAYSSPHDGPLPQLPLADRQRLYRVLLDVPGMVEAEYRDWCLQTLQTELRYSLDVQLPREQTAAVWALLQACLSRPGAVRLLAHVLHGFHPDDRQVGEFGRLVEVLLPDPLLEPAERAALLAWAARLSATDLAAGYRAAVGAGEVDLSGLDWADSTAVLERLESLISPPDGTPHPLLTFVDHLAHLASVGEGVELHMWLDQVGARLGYRPGVLRQLCCATAVRQIESRRYYLMVQLQPDLAEMGRYLLSVWLQQENTEPASVLADDRSRSLPEIVEQLDTLLEAVPDLATGEVEELIVEFSLPRELLHEPVDQWRLSRFPHLLGIRYPVVVRSLDRLRDRASHAHWRRKWQWLCDQGHHSSREAVHWLNTASLTSAEALYAHLVGRDHLVCVMMPFPPDEVDDPDNDPYAAALSAGVPAIVWSRDREQSEVFHRGMHMQLNGRGLRDLPAQILALRRDAQGGGSKHHIGRHLGLLWDDARRFPRPTRLRAPQ